jgi:catechol 2,3-dioxygenase-like lactoylglutathione lyase family enzyme
LIVRLAHVCVESADLEASEAFYQILGAQRRFDFRNFEDELIGMYLYFGEDSYIELVKISKPKKNEGSLVHFALEVNDLTATLMQLKGRGVKVGKAELGVDHTWVAICHDPSGVMIELHQYTEQSLQKTGGMCRIDYRP